MPTPVLLRAPLRIALIDDTPHLGHALLFANLIRDRAFSHGVELAGYHCLRPAEGKAWCRAQGIPWIADLSTLGEKADAIILPAASTPESHHTLLGLTLPFRLPVYIDKPLAPTHAEGVELFAIAEASGIPLMSASALRFSQEVAKLQKRFPSPHYVEIWSGWREKFDEFFIHAAELFCCLGRPSAQLTGYREVGCDQIRFEFGDTQGLLGAIHLNSGTHGFSMLLADQEGWQFETIQSAFFVQTIDAVISFLRSGVAQVKREDTLRVLEVIDHCREIRK